MRASTVVEMPWSRFGASESFVPAPRRLDLAPGAPRLAYRSATLIQIVLSSVYWSWAWSDLS
jgi:hypothetical protein